MDSGRQEENSASELNKLMDVIISGNGGPHRCLKGDIHSCSEAVESLTGREELTMWFLVCSLQATHSVSSCICY